MRLPHRVSALSAAPLPRWSDKLRARMAGWILLATPLGLPPESQPPSARGDPDPEGTDAAERVRDRAPHA